MFTVYGESCYDPCEKRDGYNYYWCHKFKDSNIGTWSDADFCRLVFISFEKQSSKFGLYLPYLPSGIVRMPLDNAIEMQ